MSGSEDLRRLTDHSAIRDLALRYCAAVDRRDWDLLAEVFVPDATVGVARSDLMRGTDEIVARYRRGRFRTFRIFVAAGCRRDRRRTRPRAISGSTVTR